ncbi:MAG: hypothetical protein AAF211_30045, partial [Myxococcota bacterium]
GNLLTSEEDEASDGTIDNIRVSTWTDDDLELTRTLDYGADGVIEFRQDLVVSDDGRRRTVRFTRDGELAEIHETTFDDQARTAMFTIDQDPSDEALDRRITWDWEVDGVDWVQTTDDADDGFPDLIETHVMGVGGLVLLEASRSDGEVYRYQEWTRDEEGRVLDTFWTNLDIEKQTQSTYRFDDRGQLLLYARREVREGEVRFDEVHTTTYFGTCE